MPFRILFSLLVFATCALSGGIAAAYRAGSILTEPCHENLTITAVRNARDAGYVAPIEPTQDEEALIDDFPIVLDGDVQDMAAVTLILADRFVDLHDNEADDLDELARVHGNPELQAQHCLRRPDQDHALGAEQAVADCRALIRRRVDLALDGIDIEGDGRVAADDRVPLDVALDIRGVVEADLPRAYVQLGMALHTVQDSFSHTYRTPDFKRITTVLNYIDYIEGGDEARDGPPHSSALDRCSNLDDYRQRRFSVAAEASTAFLTAVLAPGTRAEREQRVDAFLDEYLSYEAGCDASNDWCDAAENAYRDTGGCSCRLGRERASGAIWSALLTGALLLGVALRRERRQEVSR